ncbi:MAG: calmodulin [Pseudomonadota bacterium]
MLNRMSKCIAAGLLSCSAVFVVYAGDLFDTLDTDKSGTISAVEASAHSLLSEMFDRLDADTDGELSYQEFVISGLDE